MTTPDIPDTMQAAYIDELGPAEHIRYGELPTPQIGSTDVLVAVVAVAVDPVDVLVRSGAFPTPTPFPFVIGRDLVGRVVAVGAAVSEFAAGQWVWANSLGHGGRQGSFAQYAAVPADRLYHLPDGVDPIQAVAVAHPAATAHLGLFQHGHLRLDDAVYIGGGAGNVGDAAIRLAVAAGVHVLASATGAGIEHCRRAGATLVIDYRDEDAAQQIRAAVPAGVTVYWDTSGHHDFDAAVASVCHGGRILLSAATTHDHPRFPVRPAYTRNVSLIGFAISHATVEQLADAAAVINHRLADRTLHARIAEILPLARAAEAHRRIEQHEVSGRRLVLRP